MVFRNILRRNNHNWIRPQGYETNINIYNCTTKKKEALILRNKNIVTWYTCGPTVYDSSHIGHASCYVKLDIIKRILKNHFQLNVINTMNITDIDDKIIRKAIELNCNVDEISSKYEKEFWQDMKKLNVEKPDIVVKVTENINIIIGFIQKLLNTGKAYQGLDKSIYFDVLLCKNYGKLQNIGIQEDKKSAVKKSHLDFALWKHGKEDEPSWDSPWGKGRPGWHIECSALASDILGSNLDIHAGGIDLRFPHHENEEAQSCAFHNTDQWVNYWIHTGYLHKKHSEKMSKSLKNTVSIEEMLKTTGPQTFRMACAMASYRSNMEYSQELLNTAEGVYDHYKNFIISCNDYVNGHLKGSVNYDILNNVLYESIDNVHEALCNDFDTPSVLKVLDKLTSLTNSMFHSTTSILGSAEDRGKYLAVAVKNLVKNTLGDFGLDFEESVSKEENASEIMDNLNEFRQDIRAVAIDRKDKELLSLCDTVRDNLKKCGIIIRDHGKISSWSS